MVDIKNYKSPILFHIALNLIFLGFISYSSFYRVPLNGIKDHFYYFTLLIGIQFTVFGFLYFLSLNKILFNIIFPILFIALSISSFWVYTLDILLNESVIHATIETKSDIISDLINIPLVLYTIFIILITMVLLIWFNKVQPPKLKSKFSLLAILGIILFFIINYSRPTSFSYRLPYSIFYSIKEYYEKPWLKIEKVSQKMNSKSDQLQVIFILGESVRADHLSINGYKRETTPLLSHRKNIISFKNVFTSKTFTAISIPQILTNESVFEKRDVKYYSLIDILNHSEIDTYWIGNQTPEKSYLPFIRESKYKKLLDNYHTELSYEKALDENMLPIIRSQYNKSKKQFFLLHMMGSHWYYNTKYPENFKKFIPTTKSKLVSYNTSNEIINSYDNSILYLDFLINNIINDVEKRNSNTLLIYLSDHGESLGENGKWLHAADQKPTKNPAFIIWYSDSYAKKNPEEIKHLNKIKEQKITTDILFHTILDIYKIDTPLLNEKESLLNY